MTALTVVVHGLPAPQGSKRHVGRGILVESSKRVRPWRDSVTSAAVEAADAAGQTTFLEGPLAVDLVFVLPRPKSHYRTGKNSSLLRDGAPRLPDRLPDIDKLSRAALDALSDAGVWRDDAQVTDLTAKKTYTDPGRQARPGLLIRITTLTVEVSTR